MTAGNRDITGIGPSLEFATRCWRRRTLATPGLQQPSGGHVPQALDHLRPAGEAREPDDPPPPVPALEQEGDEGGSSAPG